MTIDKKIIGEWLKSLVDKEGDVLDQIEENKFLIGKRRKRNYRLRSFTEGKIHAYLEVLHYIRRYQSGQETQDEKEWG